MHFDVFLMHIIYQTEMEWKSFQKINELKSWFPLSLWIIYSYISKWWKLWINPINLPDGKNKSMCLDECLLDSNLVLLSAAFHRQSPADRLYVVARSLYRSSQSLSESVEEWQKAQWRSLSPCLTPCPVLSPVMNACRALSPPHTSDIINTI